MKRVSSDRGVLSLEASIMVPIFIMLMLLLNGLFVMFMGQQIMANALVQSAKSLSFDPYSVERVDEEDSSALMELFTDVFAFNRGNYSSTEDWYNDNSSVTEEAKARFLAYLRCDSDAAERLLETIGIENGSEGLDFSGSHVTDGMLTVNLVYNQEYIFNALGLATIEKELSVKVRLFEYKRIG